MSIKKISAPNTILVAIDGSLPSQMSARAAVQIANKKGLNIRGLYVVGVRTILEGDHNYKTELNINTEPTIDELMKQYKSQATEALDWLEMLCFTWGVPVTTEIIFGGIPEMILENARQDKFLAIGRRGHVHYNNVYTLGENFQNIVTRLHVPILIGGDIPTSFKRLYLIFSDHINTQNLIYWGTQFHDAFSSNILISIYGNNETHIDIPALALQQLNKEAKFSYEQVEGKIQSGSDIVVAARDHQ